MKRTDIPDPLYGDLPALIQHLEKECPGVLETSPVTQANIEEMEATAGFTLPATFKTLWNNKGFCYFNQDEVVCIAYAYCGEGRNFNHLYGFLSMLMKSHMSNSQWVVKAESLLKQFWVLGMVYTDNERWITVCDARQQVYTIYLDAPMTSISDEDLAFSFEEIIPADILPSEDAEAPEVTAAHFLQSNQLQLVTYEEVLALLGVDHLFDYWETGDYDSYVIDEYESEEAYFEERDRIFYHEGDLELNGDLEIPEDYFDLLVVNGNLTVHGKVYSWQDTENAWYVTGNATFDYLHVDYFQKTCGEETAVHMALAWAQDHERVKNMPIRKINTPFFFSWFYNLQSFTFGPDTVITALYDGDQLSTYTTNNPFLQWHDFTYAFRPEFYYPVEKPHHDYLSINPAAIYEALKNSQPVFIEGVTAEGIQLTQQAVTLGAIGDALGTIRLLQQAIEKSPAYYKAYYHIAQYLISQSAFAQAMDFAEKGIALTPTKLLYDVNCMEQAALCAVRLGEYDKATAWCQKALLKNENAYFAMRVLGEVLILQKQVQKAIPYLQKSIWHESIFSNNWLLGLAYHFSGDAGKAEEYYQRAAKHSNLGKPYSKQTDLNYVYGEPIVFDIN
ncbi:Tetratricopeptide repeat-containing protein [Filimonas lacunae]|uniref:Tetratricopeptide repeat-containing protein n=1 Tax=Filimonas lacunae TaxID=477680 RepID=A0A173MPW9_9BACT|nr:hypothetical protein [Filimonas lacunae]BAV09692.1 cytoplasmic protein [Filimonas lacunae]SIS77333.1 Tetratricopeptide repeat-containing protein [Filimonas lacunae]